MVRTLTGPAAIASGKTRRIHHGMALRICAGPGCTADLDKLGLRADAKCCSPGCRATASRAKADPDSDINRSDRFWKGLGEIQRSPTLALLSTAAHRKADRHGLGVTLTEL